MSQVIATYGSPEAPFFAVAANLIGTARFTPLMATAGIGGKVARFLRLNGRLEAPTAGATVSCRACLIHDETPIADGGNSVTTLTGRVTSGGADSDLPALATTVAAPFSAIYSFVNNASGDSQPFPARHVQLRISNPGAAYTGGTVVIETVELLD